MSSETLPARSAPRPLRKKRLRPADALFHAGVLGSVVIALGILAWLLGSILVAGLSGVDWAFLTSPTSTNAENAGFYSAIRGSLILMVITLVVAVPVGFAGALYLEKFAPLSREQLQAAANLRGRRVRDLEGRGVGGTRLARARLSAWLARTWARVGPPITRIVEVNIANLAAVPSIIYGLLGLAVFVSVLGLSKSLLAGGLTLALLVLPIIIIASREAIPPFRPDRAGRDGARRDPLAGSVSAGLSSGAARHAHRNDPGHVEGGGRVCAADRRRRRRVRHSAPERQPARGERDAVVRDAAADLLLAGDPRSEFQDLAASGIIVLLGFLIIMNAFAIFLRNRYSQRW